MTRKPHSASLVLLLICIFTFWWGISVLSQSTIPVPKGQSASQSSPDKATPVVVHESISDQTHTYSGTFASSACDAFGSGIRYTSEKEGHISVLLTSKPSSVACAQAADNSDGEPFTVSIKLPVGSRPQFDGVLLNGALIPSELIRDTQ